MSSLAQAADQAVRTSAATRPPRIFPLILATGASQALLVVLAPTLVQIGRELGASAGAAGQARSVTACVALVASLALTGRAGALNVPRLLQVGAALAVVACAGVAAAQSLTLFLAAHVLIGLAFACLLSAGFAGVAAFPPHRRAWAMGGVASANAAAWIVVNPLAGMLTGWLSWRAAEAVPAAFALGALLTAHTAVQAPSGRGALPLRALLTDVSARRWLGAELIAYGAWTAFLSFSGAFFVEILGVHEAEAGWLLAVGPAGYIVASMGTGRLTRFVSRRHLIAAAALVMAVLLPALLTLTRPVTAAALCCLIGFAAGIRTPVSGGLGMDQVPGHPGSMMIARTAVIQAGYLVGAAAGGAVISGPGYGVLGLVLAAALTASSLLVLRVDDQNYRAGHEAGGPLLRPGLAADPVGPDAAAVRRVGGFTTARERHRSVSKEEPDVHDDRSHVLPHGA